ncbi:MAG: DUF1013 domain-containing protein [Rickettsiales bacterium]|nr:MAG: DUF1013 domain-containing protein [Rickettsiales bacterium]
MKEGRKVPLKRKAVAVWLVDNTGLTFKQIAEFCDLHELEIQNIADGNLPDGIVGESPIVLGQLTREEIEKCEKNANKSLTLSAQITDTLDFLKKRKSYTPIAKRKDKPNAIAYLLKYFPDASNKQIKKIIGTTDLMIDSIKKKEYWNIKNVVPENPVLLGICSKEKFDDVLNGTK